MCMTGQKDLICVGHLNADEVIHLDDELREEKSSEAQSFKSAGGGATNTALILANNSSIDSVNLVGSVSNDKNGKLVQDALDDNGVELALEPFDDYRTTKIRAIVTENKKPMYSHENAGIADYDPSDVSPKLWEESEHLHMTSYHPERCIEFAEKANEHDMTVSFNPTQGYFDNDFSDVIPMTDLIQMNRGESEVFRERNGPLGSVVDKFNTDIVITHGPAGCTMYSRDGVASHSGYPDVVDEVVDTIGAGDTFMSGLLSEWLQDSDLERCLKVANAYGAESVKQIGAPNSVEKDNIEDILNTH